MERESLALALKKNVVLVLKESVDARNASVCFLRFKGLPISFKLFIIVASLQDEIIDICYTKITSLFEAIKL